MGSSGLQPASNLQRTPTPSSHLYYQFRHHTKRFPQNTDWIKAATDIDQWLRTGPNPD